MRLAVVSHKPCWRSNESPSGFATDGGFPMQMRALSDLFEETCLVVPVHKTPAPVGTMPLIGNNLRVQALQMPTGRGIYRRLAFLFWLLWNAPIITREIGKADAVHTPIPGDIGTIGMLIAFILRKPLFVRHCGNWGNRRTVAERFWRWFMERYAGGRNVMMATGGSPTSPSAANPNIDWIFSTSLTQSELAILSNVEFRPIKTRLRLITVGRQEAGKNTDSIIQCLPIVRKHFEQITLDIVGEGAEIPSLKKLAQTHNVEDAISFHGRLEHQSVLDLLTQAHIFCFPTSSEGFPKAVIEALACGLPTVTTRVSVLPSIIEQRGCGVIIEEVTPENIAEAILQIASNPQRHKEMASRSILAAHHYSLENWASTIDKRLRSTWGPLRQDA